MNSGLNMSDTNISGHKLNTSGVLAVSDPVALKMTDPVPEDKPVKRFTAYSCEQGEMK